MSAITIERGVARDAPAGRPAPDIQPSGIMLSAALHVGLIALIALGLPSLFGPPPPREAPIAVDLVTIAPETRATHPNPYRPRRQARPIPAQAPPAPKPKPELHLHPTAAEPPSAPPPPPPPKPQPEPVVAKAPPPPPPKPRPEPVVAKAPPIPEPKPKLAAVQQPEPPRPAVHKADARAFAKLLDKLNERPADRPAPQLARFDALLKNLTQQDDAAAADAPPAPHPETATAEASAQPKAPLGSQLTASQIDLLRQQIERCWDVPAGARDAKDLVVEIKAAVNPDGTVRTATIIDTARYATDPFFRAAADSAKRAVLDPQCTGPQNPLKLPPDQYQAWRILDLFFDPKDLL
ncbi:MAG TPA: hypothetical protein VMF86_17280 [Stellaceae bacterium]|nr:hypothetical protein [Stellaceae bacterium]